MKAATSIRVATCTALREAFAALAALFAIAAAAIWLIG